MNLSHNCYSLRSITIDDESLAPPSRDLEHERQVAIFDLLEENRFQPKGAPEGPYDLGISLVEARLVFEISTTDYHKHHVLSLSPFRVLIRDYFLICESYYAAIRQATPSQIEALDMGRRGLHDEGSRLLRDRLSEKIEIDHDTARRLFTLICALYRRPTL